MFTCPKCNTDMIWGGDHDDETDEGQLVIISNHSCPECDATLHYSTIEPED